MGLIYKPVKKKKARVYGITALSAAGAAFFLAASYHMGITPVYAFILAGIAACVSIREFRPVPMVEISENFVRDGKTIYARGTIKGPELYEELSRGKLKDCGVKFYYEADGRRSERRISTFRFSADTRKKIHNLLIHVIPLEDKSKPHKMEETEIHTLKFHSWAAKEQAWFLPCLLMTALFIAAYYLMNWNNPDKAEIEYVVISAVPAAAAVYFSILLVRWLWLSRYYIRITPGEIMLSDINGRRRKYSIPFSEIVQCEEYVKISGIAGRKHIMNIWMNSGDYIPFNIGGYDKEDEIVGIFKERAGK